MIKENILNITFSIFIVLCITFIITKNILKSDTDNKAIETIKNINELLYFIFVNSDIIIVIMLRINVNLEFIIIFCFLTYLS